MNSEVSMKHDFCISLVFSDKAKCYNIEFYGSLLQAHRAFYALAFALPLSECDEIVLFQGENEISRTTFKHTLKVR